jgi:hypothetical protein
MRNGKADERARLNESMTQADKIRELARAGHTPDQIRALTGAHLESIRSAIKRTKKIGRPRKHAPCPHCGR